jgi:exodeoxyribonuclease VII small subunit
VKLARTNKPPEFEQALAELETLVAHLERGDLPLDEALKSFERGIALTRHCQAALQAAQARVEILVKRGGEASLEPFEESAADSDSPSAGPAPAGE